MSKEPVEYKLRIDQDAAELLLWAQRNPEAAKALVEGKASVHLFQRYAGEDVIGMRLDREAL